MTDLLVTGTDTGIGKTVIAAALVKALRAKGVRAVGFKPVETGSVDGEPSDSELLARASGESISLAKPVLQLSEALAPAVAAERAGMSIPFGQMEEQIEQLRRAGYLVVVEGAGGLMVPLAWRQSPASFYSALDLALRCHLDAIVVGRAGLGTLNHVTLTVEKLRSKNIPVRAVVLNGRNRAHSDLAETTNMEALSRMLPGVPVMEVPRHFDEDVVSATVPYVEGLIQALS